MRQTVSQAISPVFAFTAISLPHGGFWQGQLADDFAVVVFHGDAETVVRSGPSTLARS